MTTKLTLTAKRANTLSAIRIDADYRLIKLPDTYVLEIRPTYDTPGRLIGYVDPEKGKWVVKGCCIPDDASDSDLYLYSTHDTLDEALTTAWDARGVL